MQRNICVFVAIWLMFFGNIIFAESNKEIVEMPEGFEGVHLGMSIEKFLKIRPNANVHPMDRYLPDQKVDLTKPDQSLGETIKDNSMFSLGMYDFKNGKLKNILLIGSWDIEHIKKYRQFFISSCIKRWDSNFQKKIFKVEPKTKKEHLAPLLVWEKGTAVIAVVCTPEYEDKTLKEGGFLICIFPKNDLETLADFSGEKVEEQTCKKLFKSIGIKY